MLEKRVENKHVFRLGMVITFEVFNQMQSKLGPISVDDVVKEYFKWILANYETISDIEDFNDDYISKLFLNMKRHIKEVIQKLNNLQPIRKLDKFEEEMGKGLLQMFYNSFISFEEVTDEQIKELLLSVNKFNDNLMRTINKCESNEDLREGALQRCREENPEAECVLENNFLVRTRCPVGTFLVPFTALCMETCPLGFQEDPNDSAICHKPEVAFRKVLDLEHDVILKLPSESEQATIEKMNNLNSKIKKTVKSEIEQIFKKIQKDFKNEDSLTVTQRSNVFEKKFRLSKCGVNFEEFELLCIPKCPEGWMDQGISCLKPISSSIRKYIALPE